MKAAPRFRIAGDKWLRGLPDDIRENGKPLTDNTIKIYRQAFNRACGVLGDMTLDSINNEVIRHFIAAMRKETFSAATIRGDLIAVKLIVESITRDGVPVYPLQIRKRYVRLPEIVRDEQNKPLATAQDIERALTYSEIAGIIAIAAGVGLRISEILALCMGDCPETDCWDNSAAIIHVRKTLKTRSSKRSIPVPTELNQYLQRVITAAPGELLFSVPRSRLYNLLDSRKLPAPHSYRRYFATEKELAGMNPNVLKRILGHIKTLDMTFGTYSRATDVADFLRNEMGRCPLGFNLPSLVPAEVPQESEAIAVLV